MAARLPELGKGTRSITQADRKAAAKRAEAGGFTPQTLATAQLATPGEAPHYFSSPNYTNSPLPLPTDVTVGNPLVARAYATDFATPRDTLGPVLVVLPSVPLPRGTLRVFQSWNQAEPGGSPTPSAGGLFHAYVLRPTAVERQYTVVFDSGILSVPPLPEGSAGRVETFAVTPFDVQEGDVLAFYGQGIPVDTGVGTDILSTPAPTLPAPGSTFTLGDVDFPVYPEARTYSFAATVRVFAGGIRKFVDALPGIGPDKANGLGQYIPLAIPDTTTYPGADYYEIAVVQYQEQLHSDLPPTTLRGYVQLSTAAVPGMRFDLGNGHLAVDPPHYLGPMIAATKGRPVRILFRNLLPTGVAGDLFIPVDTTVMGAGMGPLMDMSMPDDPLRPHCGHQPKPAGCYTENRATLHLHGGISPWISDGTPHQWISPADEATPYPRGVSVVNVPDMPDPGPGAMTFFYTNQQSARLMFYHDHSYGITRLNVYAGEAAPYVITDEAEQALIAQGVVPGPADTLPLVVQDKTFVPKLEQLAMQDPTWDLTRWSGEGGLWIPHVYSPAQNPGDSSGVNQFGRWAYGPWFWPPLLGVEHGPVPNPYYDPSCDPDVQWCEPPEMPGVPYNSMGMEAFHDTPLVNGTAYPTVTLEPKTYRLRILNAANDRFFNLSLFLADPNAPTEVALNAAEVEAALADPAGIFPTPDLARSPKGPAWIQIGTEGGFLPAPAAIPAQHITWVTDPTVFNAGNVDQHSLLLGPAERADVLVDFAAFAGKTLILYNDAPAAFPARDPRYDYYTGNADLTDTGGAPSTRPGYGPNTRTVMQIKVVDSAPAAPLNLAALRAAFAHKADGSGPFEASQHPIIVGQGGYNSAYGSSFQTNGPRAGLVQIFDKSLTFRTLAGNELTLPLQPKQIQDEQGEAFDHVYGRMSGFLGVETPNAQAGLQNMILYSFGHPPTEVIDAKRLPLAGAQVSPISTADDGTQIWKITHNGVDTHPVHFHLYDVQLLNRVGWDGIIRRPDANELGWKDTVRISPLEDTIVALRPIVPRVPFELPNSVRLIDPTMPEGAILANTTQAMANGLPPVSFAPNGEPIDIVNHSVNYGWEYMWHCHILSHEEMDMMRPISVAVAPKAPSALLATPTGSGKNTAVVIRWQDNSLNETSFTLQRAATSAGPWSTLATVPSGSSQGPATGPRQYTDPIGNTKTVFYYRVYASNVVGDTHDYTDPNLNEGASFPTVTSDSPTSNVTSSLGDPPAAPSNVTATAVVWSTSNARVTVTWTDRSSNESGFTLERAGDATFTTNVVRTTLSANTTSFTTGNLPRGQPFYFRVRAFNAAWASDPANATPFPLVTP